MTQVKRLKRQHLGIVVAEPSDLPIGSQGEFITADTLKPYLDQIAQKATPAQITTAVNALEAKILGGAGLDADTLAELNAKITALQNLTEADKTGILNLLAQKVSSTDIMPIVNAKADEASVQSRLNAKADESSVATRLATKVEKSFLEQNYFDELELTTYVQNTTDSKISDFDETVVSRLATKADESSVVSRLATKANEASVQTRLDTKANEASVQTRLDTKANEASVQTRLNAKADEASVASRLATKATEASVATRLADKADESSVATRLATKATPEQVEQIAQSFTNALEAKILGGVGTDADTMAELKALMDNLQSLSQADINGVMQAVSDKISKSSIYGVAAQGTLGSTLDTQILRGLINDNEIYRNDSQVMSAYLTLKLFKNVLTLLDEKATSANLTNSIIEVRGAAQQDNLLKLDKTDFEAFAPNNPENNKRSVMGLSLLTSDDVAILNLGDAEKDLNLGLLETDIADGANQLKVLVGTAEDGSVVGVPFANLLNFLLESPQSVIAKKFDTKLSFGEFEQLFSVLPTKTYFEFESGLGGNADIKTEKDIFFDSQLTVKGGRFSNVYTQSLQLLNQTSVDADIMNSDLPDEGGSDFLNFVLLDAEEGYTKRISTKELMNFLAFSPNSPIKQLINDQALLIEQLTTRVQELEGMFENA